MVETESSKASWFSDANSLQFLFRYKQSKFKYWTTWRVLMDAECYAESLYNEKFLITEQIRKFLEFIRGLI